MTINGNRAWGVAFLMSAAASGGANAASLHPMTYLSLVTSGGVVNPGVIVGFNPQPDPPGFPTLDLTNPLEPVLTQPAGPTTFDFVMSFVGVPGVQLLPAVQMPYVDIPFVYQNHTFDVTLTFSGPGVFGDWTWAAFNPQPDPPGVWFADSITFAGAADPSVSFTITEDGSALAFGAVPELSTWALMGFGFAALGILAYRRGARSSAVISRA
jgi:hypothetical protein